MLIGSSSESAGNGNGCSVISDSYPMEGLVISHPYQGEVDVCCVENMIGFDVSLFFY